MHLDEQEILAFVDGERDDLREHVDVCELCRRAVAEQEEARDALRASGLIDPPPLAPVIVTLPSRLPRTLTGWPRMAAILAPVAAGAIALAIVTTRGEDSRPGPQPEAATALKAAPTQQDSSRATAPAGIALGHDFLLLFRTKAAALKASAALARAGFTVRIEHAASEWGLNANKRLTEDQIPAAEAQVKRIGDRFGGRYAGGQ